MKDGKQKLKSYYVRIDAKPYAVKAFNAISAVAGAFQEHGSIEHRLSHPEPGQSKRVTISVQLTGEQP